MMRVTDQAKSDDVLETLHKSPETNTKLMLAVERRVVAHHDGKTTLSLHLRKLLLKPGELVAWIVALTPDIEVETVASVRVVGDQP